MKQKITPLITAVYFAIAFMLMASQSGARVYIDVTSPSAKKLPIAIQTFTDGAALSDIIADDLNFTGIFSCIEKDAQIERNDQPFNPANWKGLGAELVVKGKVSSPMIVTVTAYDVSEGREVLRKEYSATPDLIRPVAHSIANDLYKILTGRQGIFRTKIAYVADTSGRKTLHLMDWDGHRPYSLGIGGGILLAPRWSPDGSKIIYSAERNREWGIYLLDMKTSREKSLVSLRGLNMAGNFFPDNREFVFVSTKDGKSEIFIGDTVTLKGRKLVESPWLDVSPAVSPDGRQIIFVSNRSGGPQIFTAGKDGTGIRRLTFQGSYNTTPSWSPAGDRIVFVGIAGGKHHVFTIRADGSGLTQLTTRGNNDDPVFSSDGRFIAFSSDRDGTPGIYLMRADGEGVRRITPRGTRATRPSWSPF